jgi:hypothetical protein
MIDYQQRLLHHAPQATIDRLRRENRRLRIALVITLIAGTITWLAGLL